MSQPTTISSVESVLPAMRTFAGWISFFAFLVSVIYTILFNIGQASDAEVIQVFGYAFPYAKALLAATGALQDSTEILAFLFGFWILTLPGRKPRFLVMMATVAIILSITLVAWSIASTWGSNSAMIDQQAARGTVAREQLALIQRTIAGNEEAASDLRRNAAAIRIKAADYGSKYTSKAIEKINEAQGISAQAAELAKANLKAIEAMGQVDQDALTDINSAQAAFDRIAAATGLSPEAVGTTFLLTRASQLEAIGIISGLFVIMIPPAPRRGRGFLGRMRDGFTRGANEAADRAARSAGGFAADVAMPGAAGSRFAPALSVPDWLATQNRSHPHSDAGSGHSGTHSEGHSGNGAGYATQNRSGPHSDAARNGFEGGQETMAVWDGEGEPDEMPPPGPLRLSWILRRRDRMLNG